PRQLSRVHRRLARGVHGREGHLRPPAQRVVQRSQRLLPGGRPSGRDAGHVVREVRAHRQRPVRVPDDGRGGRRARAHQRGLRRPQRGSATGGRGCGRRCSGAGTVPGRRGPRLTAPARVIVTGLVATYPVGGVAWDCLQYVQGFSALGCEVVYLEDTGQWFYDPAAATFTPAGDRGAAYLATRLRGVLPGRALRWAVRRPDGTLAGLDEASLKRACAETDLFLNLSGSCWLRDPYRAARVAAYVDTDPCYS